MVSRYPHRLHGAPHFRARCNLRCTLLDAYRTPHYVCAAGLDCEDRIRTMSVAPAEETAVVVVSGCQLVLFDLAHANVKDDVSAFTLLGTGSHAPPPTQGCGPGFPPNTCAVLGIDRAVRKPLLASVGVDGSVRVWNYLERTCEVMKVFPEGPTSISFHPSGLQLLVGFSDKLRLMNVRCAACVCAR